MTIERFVENLKEERAKLLRQRELAMGEEKSALTRKIHTIEKAIHKAVRKGVEE